MDKIKKYQKVIIAFLEEYAKYPYQNMPEIEFQIIADRERNHFQLISIGWEQHKFIHDTIFHFDIKNEKIWVQKNATDMLVADLLISEGVEREDIILGFVPFYARAYSDFATA